MHDLTPTPTNPLAPLQALVQGPLRGVFKGLDSRTYQGQPELSKSTLDIFHACPLDYADSRLGKLKRETTPEMQQGSLQHAVILEDKHDYYVKPDSYPSKDGLKPWSGNAGWCKEWVETHNDKPILSAEQVTYLLRCRDLVHGDSRCRELLDVATGFEVSMFADHPDVDEGVKARADILGREFIADLKTCPNGSLHSVSATISRYRHHVQAAWYLDTAERSGLFPDEFYFIFLQKTPTPRLNVRRLKASAIEQGRDEYRRDLELLMECRTSGDWPGFSGGADDGIGDVDLPAWAYSQALVGVDVDVVFPDGKVVTQ